MSQIFVDWLKSLGTAFAGIVIFGGAILFFAVPDWSGLIRGTAAHLCRIPQRPDYIPPRQAYACITPRECQGRINARIREERETVRNVCTAPQKPRRENARPWREEYRKVY